MFAGGAGNNTMLPADLAAAAGTPSNLGKVGDVCACSLFTLVASFTEKLSLQHWPTRIHWG